MYEDAYEDACERCRNRLEDCECEPGFPAAFDPDLFYSPEARADANRRKNYENCKTNRGYAGP